MTIELTKKQTQSASNEPTRFEFQLPVCQKIWSSAPKIRLEQITKELNDRIEFYQLLRPAAHYNFIAQILLETNQKLSPQESLIFTSEELKHYYFYFSENPEKADQFGYDYYNPSKNSYSNKQGELIDQKKQQKLANQIYANKWGNGSEKSNDGWIYRGRGYLKIVGRGQYQSFTDWHKKNSHQFSEQEAELDFVVNPELLIQPQYAMRVAAYRWLTSGASEKAKTTSEQSIIDVNIALRGLNSRKTMSSVKMFNLLYENAMLEPIAL